MDKATITERDREMALEIGRKLYLCTAYDEVIAEALAVAREEGAIEGSGSPSNLPPNGSRGFVKINSYKRQAMNRFLPDTASPNKPATIWYMRGDSRVLWKASFMPYQPIPFYGGFDPLPGPYTVHIEWTEKAE